MADFKCAFSLSKKRHIWHHRLKNRAVSFCPMYHFAPISPPFNVEMPTILGVLTFIGMIKIHALLLPQLQCTLETLSSIVNGRINFTISGYTISYAAYNFITVAVINTKYEGQELSFGD